MEDNDTDLEIATTDGEAEALAAQLPSGDFADLKLGAPIVGPKGPRPETALSSVAGNFADMTSYVACPEGMAECDPATAPADTVYTYVHIVYPGEDMDPTSGSGDGADASVVEMATGFRMTRPAYGFTGKAGYSKGEAMAAAGEDVNVIITCLDGGLAWTVDSGDGGDQWEYREPLTFWWQSTLPPAGLADAYAIDLNGALATGPGPSPTEDEQALNACTASSTEG